MRKRSGGERKGRVGRGEERRKEKGDGIGRKGGKEGKRRGKEKREGKDTDWASGIRNREGRAARQLTEMQKKFPIQERIKRIQQEETGFVQ